MTGQPAERPPLRRDPDRGVVAGVCAGLAERLGIDAVLLRVGFAVVAIATAGLAVIAYALAWVLIPAVPGESRRAGGVSASRRRGGWRVAGGVGLLTLSALLAFRELGIWWSDALVWPLVLATSGAALLWRQSRGLQSPPDRRPTTAGIPPPPAARAPRPLADLYRGGFGIALVVGAALLFLSTNDAVGAPRDAILATLAGVLALGLILAPFLWRLGRNLVAERAERIRTQERAELAAHVHDSVLQTLTLVQKRAGDPREVAALARRQERELRAWLFDRPGQTGEESLSRALSGAAAAAEDAHGIVVDVVAVGDRLLDDPGRALVAAVGEALTNAAKFAAEAGPVAVYAEMDPDRAQVFVRDRGPGFEQAVVPADRRGLRESILGRMERNGGVARVRSAPGTGTEVELSIGAANR